MLTPFQAQRLRLQRILLASAGLAFFVALTWLAYVFDHLSLSLAGMLGLTGFVALSCLSFIVLVRTQINLRFADPSMTQAQMLLAIVTMLMTAAFADDFHFLLLAASSMVLLFGVFKLDGRGFIQLGSVLLAGFALLSGWRLVELEGDALSAEIEQGIAFVMLVIWLTLMGSEISRVRHGLQTQVRELTHALNLAQQQVITDDLTGLYNRRQAHRYLDQQQAMMARGGHGIVLALLDIQQLSRVNAEYGSEVGDQVLMTLAKLLRGVLRDVDFVARLGGDEFLMVLNYTDRNGAEVVAERLAAKIAAYCFTGLQVQVRVRIGLAQAQRGETWEETLKRSGDALQVARDKQVPVAYA